jgi:lysophospholipase L1-like esterase
VPGRRRFALPLLASAIGVVTALCLGEILFRIMGIKALEAGRIFRISNGADLQFPGRAGHTVIDLYGSNPRGAFPVDLNDSSTRAGLIREKFTRVDEARKTNSYGVPFRYNSKGFRDRDFSPKPQTTTRVVFVGDSFTEAQGVVEEATAVRLVEGRLRGETPGIEVWNLGVRGHDFPDLETIFDTGMELSPDAVILGMVLNDADRGRELTENWPRVNDWIMVRETSPSWLARHSSLFGFIASRYERFQVSRETTAWYRALYSEQNQAGWMRTRAALQRMRARCLERKIGFGVALWPLLVGLESADSYPFEAAHAQIRRGVERARIPFLDLLPTLRGRPSSSLWVHTSDLHPNEEAQKLVAPVLAEFVRERLRNTAVAQPVAK